MAHLAPLRATMLPWRWSQWARARARSAVAWRRTSPLGRSSSPRGCPRMRLLPGLRPHVFPRARSCPARCWRHVGRAADVGRCWARPLTGHPGLGRRWLEHPRRPRVGQGARHGPFQPSPRPLPAVPPATTRWWCGPSWPTSTSSTPTSLRSTRRLRADSGPFGPPSSY